MSGIVQQMCRDAGFTAQVAHEVAETSTIMTFVAAGLGIAVIPEPTSTYGAPGIAYVPIVDAPYVERVAVTRSEEQSPVCADALEKQREIDQERTHHNQADTTCPTASPPQPKEAKRRSSITAPVG